MKRLVVGGLAALAISLTGCTVVGQPTTASPQPNDFAVEITVVGGVCGEYVREIPRGECLYSYDLSVRWLPAVPLPSGMTTVTYRINGGKVASTGGVQFSGSGGYNAQTFTNPGRRLMIAREGAHLTGTATEVTVT